METSKLVMSFNLGNTEYNIACIYRDKIIHILLNAVSNANDMSTVCLQSVVRHLRKAMKYLVQKL